MAYTLTTDKIKGMFAAGMVALMQGSEAIFFSLFGLIFISDFAKSPEFSGAVLGIKEIFGVIIVFILFRKKAFAVFKKLKQKNAIWFSFSGTMTAIGNLFFIFGIVLGGTAYGTILTALYPIFSMLILRIFFKDKQNKIVWLGAFIVIIGGLLFVVLPSFINNEVSGFNKITIIGMCFGLFSALFWSLEGIFIKKASDIKTDPKLENKEIVVLRTTSSMLVTIFVLMPFLLIFRSSGHNVYFHFKNILSNKLAWIIVLIISINIVALRIVHLYAIHKIGPKTTAIIDTNNFIIPSFFTIFLVLGKFHFLHSNEEIFIPIIWWSWFLVIPIFLGVFIVVYFEKASHVEQEIFLDRNN